MAKTILESIIEKQKQTKQTCDEFGIDYEYEIFNHDKYVVVKEKDLDKDSFEYHLYGKENSKNKGFICTFPKMRMAMRMIGSLED